MSYSFSDFTEASAPAVLSFSLSATCSNKRPHINLHWMCNKRPSRLNALYRWEINARAFNQVNVSMKFNAPAGSKWRILSATSSGLYTSVLFMTAEG